MGLSQLDSFAVYVGIDWALSKHDVCIHVPGEQTRRFETIPHQVEDIDLWVRSLKRQHGGPIAVAIELSKGPIISILDKYDFIVLFPINPLTLAKYRTAFKPSRAKDDPTDAELAIDLLLRHPDKFAPLQPQSTEMRMLATLVEQRRHLVADRVRITNRLRSALNQYYPQALEWFDHIDSRLFCSFIERWPTLIQAKRARPNTLLRFFHDNHVYRHSVVERRVKLIRNSTPMTEDEAVVVPNRMHAIILVGQLRAILDAIDTYDKQINEVATKHPDYALFRALPGAGPSLAPRLLVAFGEQRDRFKSAADLQKYSGVAPVTERSGKKHWVHWRWQCPTFLRQTFVEWAGQTINKSYWAGQFYQQQRDKGCTYQAAVRALAFKWIRILYRCWQTGIAYDESVYLKALERRGSPLLKG